MQDPTTFQPMKPHFPEQEQLQCPRCDSTNTKFCYYNNYNLSQPRHFCKNCRRYWTKGGTLRNIPVGGGSKSNIPVGGGSRKSTKRSSSSKRSASSSPSLSVSSAFTAARTAAPEADPTRISTSPNHQDPLVLNDVGSFSSLLASTGHLGSLLEGLSSSGSSLKAVHIGEFGENPSSGPVVNSDSGRNPMLGMQIGGSSESLLGEQNGDSSFWNGSNGWSDLAIYTPSPSFQ